MDHGRGRTSGVRLVVAAAAVTLGAIAPIGGQNHRVAAQETPTVAGATLVGLDGNPTGVVSFAGEGDQVRVEAEVRGLEPGFHGFHVHETGSCDPAEKFAGAGKHLGHQNASHAAHQGDMPPLYAQQDGAARTRFRTDRVTIEDLLADGGRAVIVHAEPDNLGHIPPGYRAPGSGVTQNEDEETRNTGDAGGRVACGTVTVGHSPMPAGYFLVASDGGIFNYGNVAFMGSRGGEPLNRPIVAMTAAAGSDGYYLTASDGGIFSYGDAPFAGSTGDITLNSPIVGMAAVPVEAKARLIDTRGFTIGTIHLMQGAGHVRIRVSVRGISPNFHGFHIHTSGICDSDSSFLTAGGHLGASETVSHADHPGDLPALFANSAGVATADLRTDRFRLEDLFDEDGAAFIVHGEPDNFAHIDDRYSASSDDRQRTRETGDAGDRAACGVIEGNAEGKPLSGYWLAASDGGVFAFGDAAFLGSAGSLTLTQPVVGLASTPTGDGYWLVAADGGIFNYGDAPFVGSTGDINLNSPIVAIAPTPSGNGYWLVAADGGVFNFGDAVLHGSLGDTSLNSPIVSTAATASGDGYWLFAADGGVFAFGDAFFTGSAGALSLNRPIVGAAADPG